MFLTVKTGKQVDFDVFFFCVSVPESSKNVVNTVFLNVKT